MVVLSRPWANAAPIVHPLRLAPDARTAALTADDGLPAPAVERDATARADASTRSAADGVAMGIAPDQGAATAGSVLQLDAASAALAGRADQRPQPRRAHPCEGLDLIHHEPSSQRATGFPHQCGVNRRNSAARATRCAVRGRPWQRPCGYPGSAPGSTARQNAEADVGRASAVVDSGLAVRDPGLFLLLKLAEERHGVPQTSEADSCRAGDHEPP